MHLHHRCRDANAAKQTHQFFVAPDYSLQDKARAQGDGSVTEPSPTNKLHCGARELAEWKVLRAAGLPPRERYGPGDGDADREHQGEELDASVPVVYDENTPEALHTTAHQRPLHRRPSTDAGHVLFPGVVPALYNPVHPKASTKTLMPANGGCQKGHAR